MLINFDDTVKFLNDVRSGKVKEGLKLGIPEIDEWIRFKPRNFNVILGHTNVGKTTLILYLMLAYSMRHNLKWLVFSSENESYSVIRKLSEFLAQKPINLIDSDVYHENLKWIREHFFFISADRLYTYKDLMKFIYENSALGINGFLLDPYNSLAKDKELMSVLGGHEYDYEASTELRMMCKELEICTWINAHASTNALRMKHPSGHQYEGHPIPPQAADIEGGGKFVNRADDFMVIHRYLYHPQDWVYTDLHIKKVKEVETGGRPTAMDSPIRFKSMLNNVGFTVNGQSIINVPKTTQGSWNY